MNQSIPSRLLKGYNVPGVEFVALERILMAFSMDDEYTSIFQLCTVTSHPVTIIGMDQGFGGSCVGRTAAWHG